MNNTFNMARFGRLFIKHSVEHYKIYLMSLAVLTGVLLLGGCFMVYMMDVRMEVSLQLLLLSWVVFFTGTVFTSMIFADMGDKKKAIVSLTLPASHFEKYLVAWIYSFVVFLVLSTSSYYMVMLFLLHISHFPGPQDEIFSLFTRVAPLNARVIYLMLILYGLLHAIAFYGAIYFKKMHFIKTALVFFLTLVVLFIIDKIMLHLMLGKEVIGAGPFSGAQFVEDGKIYYLNVNMATDWLPSCTYIVLTCILWVAAYYRLKEKQV